MLLVSVSKFLNFQRFFNDTKKIYNNAQHFLFKPDHNKIYDLLYI